MRAGNWRYAPGSLADGTEVDVCMDCGALVGEKALHDVWHDGPPAPQLERCPGSDEPAVAEDGIAKSKCPVCGGYQSLYTPPGVIVGEHERIVPS